MAGTPYIPRAADEYFKARLPQQALDLLFGAQLYEKVIDGLIT